MCVLCVCVCVCVCERERARGGGVRAILTPNPIQTVTLLPTLCLPLILDVTVTLILTLAMPLLPTLLTLI